MVFDEIHEMNIDGEIGELVESMKEDLRRRLSVFDIPAEKIKFVGLSFHFIVPDDQDDYAVISERIVSKGVDLDRE